MIVSGKINLQDLKNQPEQLQNHNAIDAEFHQQKKSFRKSEKKNGNKLERKSWK